MNLMSMISVQPSILSLLMTCQIELICVTRFKIDFGYNISTLVVNIKMARMKFGRLKDWLYMMSTDDKYADSRKSFNRVNRPDETNLLYNHNYSTVSLLNGNGASDGEAQTPSQQENQGIYEVRLAWRHIKNWLSTYAPDLYSSLQSPCTDKDLAEFQKDLNIRLPPCVLEFYKLTDGQSEFNRNGSGGIIFGLKLMPIDEIVVMVNNWREVARRLNVELSHKNSGLQELKKIQTRPTHPSSEDIACPIDEAPSASRHVKREKVSLVPTQHSIPPGAVHESFAHPFWIPIATDEVGNCIGLDLSPPAGGPGICGQIILFGREFDTKYVIADNLGDFLLLVANDLEWGNWSLKPSIEANEEDLTMGSEGELVFFEKSTKEEKNYLDVLKYRSIKRWYDDIDKLDSEKVAEARKIIADSESGSPVLNYKDTRDLFISTQLSAIDHFKAQDVDPSKSSSLLETDLVDGKTRRADFTFLNDTKEGLSKYELLESSKNSKELEPGMSNLEEVEI